MKARLAMVGHRGWWRVPGLLLVLFFVVLPPSVMAEEEQQAASPAGYGSLAELIHLIGEDAAGEFVDFFTAGPVQVTPFAVLSEGMPRRLSFLGVTLADQMRAVINRVPESAAAGQRPPASQQMLWGWLQEIDGCLRVHISGRNSHGQWRSYVANVEMSAAVYRAMHTYVAYGQ
ncbi:hypothetical protein [Desulfurivibrio dismutans]|uniref:hypothetical protein n=1 Tax=Desulfurivibrio dismutans TaxID=1398908 RepID=UPI0023DA070A|nr:hypothetical protein [Desulfurivibrio alkaliphilus]MDF1613975.1 hypothetical protein [Desulfurivibrio alkaliphilus]